jgi:twitching motility protein PilT
MRRLQSEIPTLEKLALPAIFREIVKEKNGIILVTGATGMGKTTTLAAMLNELNQSQEIHIVTLEDPIEFFHAHGKAAISQRELGKDFPNFADGLRAALRQAPKAILVGEIRDRETLEIAMTASETGHIVFSTLHTISAGQTINRILGMFAREEEQQLRQRLCETLRYVVSQRLVNKIGGGRLLVTEIMGSSLRTRETILYGESENKSFQEIIEAGSTLGWHSFDQSIIEAYKAGIVSEETAMVSCTNKGKMRRELDLLQRQRGAAAEQAPSGLKLNIPEPIRIIEEPAAAS